jgi:outer membrane protein OmpA-like peptidoglycan-associated protein
VVTVNGDLTVKSDSRIVFGTGSKLTASDISLLAENTGSPLVKGIRANATAVVTLDGATLTTTSSVVTLGAVAKVDMTGSKAEDGDTFFSNGLAATVVTSFSTATINIIGDTTINAGTLNVNATVDADIEASVQDSTVKVLTVFAAGDARVNIGDNKGTTTVNVTGDLTAEAKSDVTVTAKSQPSTANTDRSVDAAIVNVNVVDVAIPVLVPAGFTSGADMTVGGKAVVTAGNKATFKATDLINVTTTADGTVPDTFGATFGLTIIDSDTTAAITGTAAVTSPTVDLAAATTRTIATTAKSTPGGAEDKGQTNNKSQQELAKNKAATSDGDFTLAAAVAVSHVGGTTNAFVDSAAGIAVTATTALNVGSTSTDTVSVVADGSGTGSPGLAIAAALNFVNLQTNAFLDGAAVNLKAGTVNVTATENAASTFKAEATSGAGSDKVGIAGALTVNSVNTSTRAFVDDGTTATLNGGSLNLTAANSTKSVSEAKPKADGATGKSLGFGASVAFNLIDNLTEAAVETGAAVTGGSTVKIAATGDHDVDTKATIGASGGTAITPVVAMAFVNNTTRAVFDTGSNVSATKNIDGEATQDVDVTTAGKGDAQADKTLAIGAVFAFTSLSDVVAANAFGTLTTTGGNVGLKSQSRTKSKTDSTASASGAANKGKNVDQQAAAQKDAAQKQGGQGSSKGTPGAKTADGPITVAAAVSISVVDANVSATASGAITAANGTVTIGSFANQDDSAVADGQATKAGSFGAGAAVAISRADLANLAQIADGGSVKADGITVEAGMRDVGGDKRHDYSSSAKSGAGSEGGIGVAGALGLTISTTDTRARLATGGTVTLADGTDANTDAGEFKVSAAEDAKNAARAEPTVSGDSFGFGASVAFAIPTHRTTAEVEDQAVVTGAKDVTVLSKSKLETESFAKAGVKAGVALSPVVAVTMVDTTTTARVGIHTDPDGNNNQVTVLTGNLTVTADHFGDSESHAAGSVESGDAAIGLSVAVTTTEDRQDARLERSVTAGGTVTVEAIGLHDDSAQSQATAKGAKDKENDTSGKNVDQKAGDQSKAATEQQQQNPPTPPPQVPPPPVPPPPGVAEFTFAHDEDALGTDDKAKLNDVIAYLKANPNSFATVHGFTDSSGNFAYNVDLAKRRAEHTRDYLVEQGVNPAQLRVEYFGESAQKKTTADGVREEANRRAEVRVQPPTRR